jgi:multiple sugar transport system substrate-binding protein
MQRWLFQVVWWVCLMGGGVALAQPVITLRHTLWDAAQRPGYQQCARDFERAQPHIRIKFQQLGWDDYWQSLSTGFVAETAPDVFTNHITKFAEQAANGVLLDLAPYLRRAPLAADHFEPGLLQNWQRGAAQYALPADWDTVALVVNLAMLRRAGLDEATLKTLHWNPQNGGSFGQLAAQLTRDANGRNALHPAFDKTRVAVYGYQNPGSGGLFGQTEWSHFALSNGFRYQAAPWRGPLLFDDTRLHATLDWLAGLAPRGISASPQAMGKLGADAMFISQRAAMVPAGAWMVGYFTRNARFAHAFVPLPVGPSGQRATLLNGLGHSIWRGSRQPEAAWAWVRHLGSAECQRLVAAQGVVYPAVRGLSTLAAAVQRRAGAEPQAFLDMAQALTVAPPVIDRSAQVSDVIGQAIDTVLLGQSRAAPALGAANLQANRLLGPAGEAR